MTFQVRSARTLRAGRDRAAIADPVIPDAPVAVDVVIPFHADDACYLAECLEAIGAQRHCAPVVHIIADRCEFPQLPHISAEMFRYRHSKPMSLGPYRLTNALVKGGHCQTDFLAIQDADDISLPDRMWRHVQTMRATGAGMISSAMQNFIGDESEAMQQRHDGEAIVRPGVRGNLIPFGRCVNSCRTMRRSLFEALNGFRNMLCSGDFEFDNRARRFGRTKVVDDQTILGRRRLHSKSLSHGIVPLKTPDRDHWDDLIRNSLAAVTRCRTCAPTFGALQTAYDLEVV